MITFDAKQLQAALKELSPAISANAIIPAHEYVLCMQEGSTALLRASNSELHISIALPATGECKPFLMPYKELSQLLPESTGEVVMKITATHVIVTNEADTWKIATLSPEGFSQALELNAAGVPVDASYIATLKDAVVHSGYKVGDPRCEGVCISGNDIAASDKFRLYVQKTGFNFPVTVQIPVSFINALTVQDGVLTITDSKISFSAGGKITTGTLLANAFIHYPMLMPDSINYNVSLPATILLDKVKKACAFRDVAPELTFSFLLGRIDFSYSSMMGAREYAGSINVEHSVDIEPITLNANIIREVLNSHGDDLQLSFLAPNKFVYVKSEKQDLFTAIAPIYKL